MTVRRGSGIAGAVLDWGAVPIADTVAWPGWPGNYWSAALITTPNAADWLIVDRCTIDAVLNVDGSDT